MRPKFLPSIAIFWGSAIAFLFVYTADLARADVLQNTNQVIWNSQGQPPLGSFPQSSASIQIDGSVFTGTDLYVTPYFDGSLLTRANFFVDRNGNVGIKLPDFAPQARLDVGGTGRFSGNVTVGSQELSLLPLTGPGSPSGTAALGQIYIDTAAQDAWIFTGTWKKITCCGGTVSLDQSEMPSVRKRIVARPNPSDGGATIRFSLQHAAAISVAIFDNAGRVVQRLVDGAFEAGDHSVEWNGLDNGGQKVPSGVYFVQVAGEGNHEESRIVLTR